MKILYPAKILVSLLVAALWVGNALADELQLPARTSPIPQTTNGVPHVQIGVTVVPQIAAELLRQAELIPGVEIRETSSHFPAQRGSGSMKACPLPVPRRSLADVNSPICIPTAACMHPFRPSLQNMRSNWAGDASPLGQPATRLGRICDDLYAWNNGGTGDSSAPGERWL